MLVMLAVVSLWTPFLSPSFNHRWFAWPGMLATGVAPALCLVLAVVFFRSLRREDSLRP